MLWSTGGLFVKLLPQDAYTILFYRSLYTSIFFILVFREKIFKINKYSIISALCYAPLLLCFVVSTKMTTAANSIFLQSTGVVYVLMLEPIWRKTKLLKVDIITVILCFIGMSLFLVDGFSFDSINIGIYIAMFSGLMSAAVMLSQKMNTFQYLPSGIVMGNLLVVLITLPSFFSNPYPTTNENLMLLFLGFVQLGCGFLLFAYGQKFIDAIDSALISILEPIFNPIWVAIGYGEIPGALPLIGGLLIVFSLLSRSIYVAKKTKPQSP